MIGPPSKRWELKSDLGRKFTTRRLLRPLGRAPSRHSSGDNIRRGGITKTGNRKARRMLIKAAWSYLLSDVCC
jgi:transposase